MKKIKELLKYLSKIFKILIDSETKTTAGKINGFGMILYSIILILIVLESFGVIIINVALTIFNKNLPGFSSNQVLIALMGLPIFTLWCVKLVKDLDIKK